MKVLKGQGCNSWTETTQVTVQRLEIPRKPGALTPWATALRPLTEVNSQKTPHRLPLQGPAIAEKQPDAGHTLSKGASSIPAGQDTKTQSTHNCPTQATRGRSCSSKERPGASEKPWPSQLTESQYLTIAPINMKRQNFDPVKTSPDSFDICYIFP